MEEHPRLVGKVHHNIEFLPPKMNKEHEAINFAMDPRQGVEKRIEDIEKAIEFNTKLFKSVELREGDLAIEFGNDVKTISNDEYKAFLLGRIESYEEEIKHQKFLLGAMES
jgi:hypothetical protein